MFSAGSKFFLAPINTGFGMRGQPDERLLDFHRLRAGREIGVGYVGNVAIDAAYRTNQSTLVLTKDSRWVELANAIRRRGSLPGIQLACRVWRGPSSRKWRNPERQRYVDRTRRALGKMSSKDIRLIVDGFVSSAIAAADLGFEVVQLHAAHGYFLSELLSPALNHRTDEFVDGAAIIGSIISELRHRRPNVAIDVRFSLFEGLRPAAAEIATRWQQIDKIAACAPHILSVSNGLYDVDRFMIYPPRKAGPGIYISNAQDFATRFPNTAWNVAGNIWDLRLIPRNAPSNLTFGIGRSLIADPDFVRKSLNGDSRLVACTRSGHCHYYSRTRSRLECGVNAEFGVSPLQSDPASLA